MKRPKDLEDLLNKLKTSSFSGKIVKPDYQSMGINVKIEYSPQKFKIENENPQFPEKGVVEIEYDSNYNIRSYKEGTENNLKALDVNKLKGYGIIGNLVKRDPRYVIMNSKDFKKINSGYRMTIWDDDAKELSKNYKETGGLFSNIFQYAEIYFDNKGIKRMVIENYFEQKKKRKIFVDIVFN